MELTLGSFEQTQEKPPVYVYVVKEAGWFTLSGVEGMLVAVDGETVENSSLFRAEQTIELSWPEGAEQNPVWLVTEREYAITVPETGYWFRWEGEKAGTLEFDWADVWEIAVGEDRYSQCPVPVKAGVTLLRLTAPVGEAAFRVDFVEEPKLVEVAKGKTVLLTGPKDEVLTVADYIWRTESGSVATVSAGKVTAKGVVGTETLVTATHKTDGTVLRYRVVITQPVQRSGVRIMDGDYDATGQTATVYLTAGEGAWVLTGKTYPENASDGLIWTSSNPEFAEVDGTGTVSFKGKGAGQSVIITATATDGSKEKGIVKFKIVQKAESVVSTEDLVLEVAEGKTLKLAPYVQVLPDCTTNKKVSWSIAEGSAYAKISSGGVLTAAKGLTQIETVKVVFASVETPEAASSITVRIVPGTAAVKLYRKTGTEEPDVTGGTVAVTMGTSSADLITLRAVNEPAAAAQTWQWKASDKNVEIAAGETAGEVIIRAKAGFESKLSGKTITITATAGDGTNQKSAVKLKLTQPVEGLTLPGTVGLAAGKSVKLAAELQIAPAYATNRKVSWEIVQGGEFAKLTNAGVLTANKGLQNIETVKVRCTALDGSGKIAETEVTVCPVTASVVLKRAGAPVEKTEMLTLNDGPAKTLEIAAFNEPADAAQAWDWKVSDKTVAVEYAQPNVVRLTFTSGQAGKNVTITATAKDGSGKKASFQVKVIQPVEEVTLLESAPAVLALTKGKTLNLSKLVQAGPAKATNKKLIWTLYGLDENGGRYEIPAAEASISNGSLKAPKITKRMDAVVVVTPQDGCLKDDGTSVCKALELPVTLYPAPVAGVAILDGEYDATGQTGTLRIKAGEATALWDLDARTYGAANAAEGDFCPDVIWSSANQQYATVDENGVVTAHAGAIGKNVIITATAADGSGKKAIVKIKILAAEPEADT